ncbi:MAG: Clp protease ClpP [Rhizobiales bacterium]|nr:Clp protease ClpP [Hyphomicrobiales bacterium]
MSLRTLPQAKVFDRPKNFQWDAVSDVLAKWAELAPLAAMDDGATISIFDVIGEDMFTGGFTAKRMDAALRSIGKNDVTVKINSPGGDMFEGIAIYNLLREHPAKVTVHVMGWAASAASIIAMAGDDIAMGLGSFMMVHNAWGMVIGNRHDMRDAADLFDGFDSAIVDIYEARASVDRKAIETLMDKETFMSPSMAVDKGFADFVDEGIAMPENSGSNITEIHAKRRTDAILAKSGVPRSERRKLLKEIAGGTQNAAASVTHDADLNVAGIQQLIETIRG